MPLHPNGREGDSARRAAVGDAALLPLPHGVSDLQRLRHVTVQEDAGRPAQSRPGEMEACHAPDPAAALGHQHHARRLRAGQGGGASRKAAGDPAGRDALGRSGGLAEASASRIQRCLGGDEPAPAPGLRAGQCVPDRGPPIGPVGEPAMMNEPRLLRQVELHPYPLLFATISGAHLYGFPSPDSDYDLRGVHLLPVREVVGLDPGRETIEVSAVRDGLEIDLVTHDVKKFFGLLLKKNGYVLEQLFSPLVLHTTPEHEELKAIAKTCITRHHSHHYFGFAETQWGLFDKERPRRVKPLLYVYRVLLTGIHLMRSGEVEANLVTLNAEFKLPYISDLIERKLTGPEKSTLSDVDVEFHRREFERLRGMLEDAYQASSLSETPAGKAALNDLLIRLRLGAKATN